MADDPSQLRLLALVEAHGSLSGAAAELALTPAAVTAQVARAEAAWGCRSCTEDRAGHA